MSKHYETKQVILMRTDLRNKQGQKVRSGKLMAQAAHVSMMFLTKRLQFSSTGISAGLAIGPHEQEWLKGSFAKIVLAVDSLDDMTALVEAAKKVQIEAHTCVDNGATEFNVPTTTCAAIGPFASDEIDKITGHLKPL